MKKYALIFAVGFVACGGDDASLWCDRAGGPSDDISANGDVVAKVCYGPTVGSAALRVEDEAGDGTDLSFPQTRNNEVVVFDASTDGDPIPGDIFVDGNKISIYGNGSDKTILDGNVTLAGNSARVRGVTITGNLLITLNNAAIVDTVIRGNVEIRKNNTVLASSSVYGDVVSTSNNNVFVDDRVQGSWSIGGHNAACEDNHAFTDDGDFVIDDDELGAALSCG